MKAILVIDVDEKDIGRKVNYISVQGGGMSYTVGTMGEDVRLKPMPEKKILDEELFMLGNFRLIHARFTGWNDCIDTITGETGGEQNEERGV